MLGPLLAGRYQPPGSDFVNNMEEDVRNTVLVLKNYDGQDLGEFRRNLTTYGAIKVRTVEGTDGGVDSLEISGKL